MQREIIYLRPEQILSEIDKCPVVYIPFGLIEWHGPALPVGTDGLNASEVARLAADITGGLVFPTCYIGTERERPAQMLEWLGLPKDGYIVGMDFPGNSLSSLYSAEETFAMVAREQIRMAISWGFRLIVLLTGHAAENQLAVLERLKAEYNATGDRQVLVALPFVRNAAGILEVGHASKIETSLMMALHPEAVELGNLPDLPDPLLNAEWAIIDYQTFLGKPTDGRTVHLEDDPRMASAETGRQTLQHAVEQLSGQVNNIIQTWTKQNERSI